MATKKTFEEFRQALEAGELSWNQVKQYVELDPDSPVIRLRIRRGALTAPIPDDYDVDAAVYRVQQERSQREPAARIRGVGRLPVVIAEGDSWFNLPPIVRPLAIADRMRRNGIFDVRNIAHWGDTLAEMVEKKQYLRALGEVNAKWLILSAGGNDMQDALSRQQFLLPYDANRSLEQSISANGVTVLSNISTGYVTVLSEVRRGYPEVAILCYAYDYPKPTAVHKEYIGKHLTSLRYPKNTWSALLKIVLDQLAAAVMKSVAQFPGVVFLDCFNIAQPYPWFDDMHPDTDGFKALAKAFETRMAGSIGLRASAKKRTRPTAMKAKRKGAPAVRVKRKETIKRPKR